MTPRATNLVLFAAVPSLVLTGLFAWALPESAGAALLVAHRAIASAIIVALAWKEGIARRSARRRVATRRWSTLMLSGLTSVALLLTLGLGLLWTVGLLSFDRPFAYSLLNVHVFAGIALVPLVIAHAAQRSSSGVVRAPLSRRDVIRGSAVLAGGVILAAALDRVDPARRPTGSRVVAAPAAEFPVTSWAFDRVPTLAPEEWRLSISGTRRRSVSLADLLALPQVEQVATLDCTGGWASTHRWRGVGLASLAGDTGRQVRVTSVTGHTATFAPHEIGALLLATHVDGVTLSPEHGAPVRLVAPLHRGFLWVKWVTRIEVL